MEKINVLLTSKQENEIHFNPFNYLTVSWLSKLLLKGWKKTIDQSDLFALPKAHKSETLDAVCEPFWTNFQSEKPSKLTNLLWNHVWWRV
jgi:hypothetical protein